MPYSASALNFKTSPSGLLVPATALNAGLDAVDVQIDIVTPSDATKFLNGAATPAYAQVKDSDLSTSDITTNNVSTSKHGFAPKLPNDASKYLDGTGAYTVPSGGGGGSSLPAVRAYNNASISISNNVTTVLTFNSERWDTNAMHSTSSNTSRLTCVTAGKYVATVCVSFAANATGIRDVLIRLNATTDIAQILLPNAGGTFPTIIEVTATVDMAVNDYLEAYVYQNSGGNLNVLNAADYSPEFSAIGIRT